MSQKETENPAASSKCYVFYKSVQVLLCFSTKQSRLDTDIFKYCRVFVVALVMQA